MAVSQPDYFVSPRVLESFAKTVKEEGQDAKKYIFLSFLLNSEADLLRYAIDFKVLDVNVFKSLIVSAKYGDNLTAEQISNLEKQDLKEFAADVEEPNRIILPYTTAGVKRIYRIILDITSYDGVDGRPDYRDVWNNLPLTIVALLEDTSLEIPKLTLDLAINDCDITLKELSTLIDGLSEDLPIGDVEFLKNIITHCNCGLDTQDNCEVADVTFNNVTLPSFESESVLYELANVDKLICYLKNQIIKYKTEITITSGSGSACYKFVPCLIRAFVSLNKVFNKAKAAHEALLVSSRYLVDRYNVLAADHRRGIEAMKGIVNSNTEWIKANLDANFDIKDVTCSNRVSATGDLAYTFQEKYSSFFSTETKRYSGYDA